MGIIDKTKYKLHCESCGVDEQSAVLDKGSNWGGSSWQGGAKFENFETEWTGGGSNEPELIHAKCSKCGSSAIIEVE